MAWSTRLARGLVVAGTVAAMAVAGTGASAARRAAPIDGPAGLGRLARFYSPAAWGRCAHGIPAPFQCAWEPVPLSYADPSGPSLRLMMIRLPASDPAKRIGSLLVNFGGPGGPGVSDLAARAYTVFSPAIRARFDLVSWDPRGIEYSSPVNCFASASASQAYYASVPVFPYPQSREAAYFATTAELGADCEQRQPHLIAHVSSADTARDLNLLRADLGDAKLNYLGFSYGTVIGAIYSNLFPGRVRAMVLDGAVDPEGNATGDQPGQGTALPVDVRQGVDQAGQDTFDQFLALCARAGTARCAFAAGGDLRAKWATLLARAQARKLSYQNLMLNAYYRLEDPIADWPGLATTLQHLYTATNGGASLSPAQAGHLAAAARAAVSAAGAAGYASNRTDAYNAIQCEDSVVPTQTSIYHNLAISEDAKVPGFGRLVVYDMMACATWPTTGDDAYAGPWNRSRTTILVINALYDPITPILGARAAVRELVRARLLAVNGHGHTSMYVEPSTCRDDAELAYLTTGKLPLAGTVCQVNALPFGLAPPR